MRKEDLQAAQGAFSSLIDSLDAVGESFRRLSAIVCEMEDRIQILESVRKDRASGCGSAKCAHHDLVSGCESAEYDRKIFTHFDGSQGELPPGFVQVAGPSGT